MLSRLKVLTGQPKLALGALLTLLLAATAVVGSGADFTATSANPSNTFASGTLTIENSNDGLAVLDRDGRVVRWNRQLEELHGIRHEDAVVTSTTELQLNPERVRNIFLGLNDGLIEILGAVSGFFAALGNASAVLMASITVAVAGALSMAAGAWAAVDSEAEIRATEAARRRFLGEPDRQEETSESPLRSALVVGTTLPPDEDLFTVAKLSGRIRDDFASPGEFPATASITARLVMLAVDTLMVQGEQTSPFPG